MSSRLAAILEVVRSALISAESLEPAEADILYANLLATMRARRPKSVSPLTLGPPTEPIRDPRGDA